MRQKILIIESDAKDRKAMIEILSIVGFKSVISAQTGKEGIEKVKSNEPEVVVVALVLSDFKGFDVCQKIKSMDGHKPKVILITGKLQTVEPSWAKNSGADQVLVKSSSYESLCQAVVKLI